MSSLPARQNPLRYAWLSLLISLWVLGLKLAAWILSGSVTLLSDALESLVNLAASLILFVALYEASRPPDDAYAHGRGKVEYIAMGLEGLMILIASGLISWAAVERLLVPRQLEGLTLSLIIALVGGVSNAIVASVLVAAGKRHESDALISNGTHLWTDVWSSAGGILGVALAWVTGWWILDPLLGLFLASMIAVAGVKLLKKSYQCLLDRALPEHELAQIITILESYQSRPVTYHALRTRLAGSRRFLSVHLLFPGEWTMRKSHSVAEEIEAEIRNCLPGVSILTHLEPNNDPRSWEDEALDRVG